MQPDKGLLDSSHQVVIHGEGKAVPVHTDPHASHLPKDLAAICLHPAKHLLQESFPACDCTAAACPQCKVIELLQLGRWIAMQLLICDAT